MPKHEKPRIYQLHQNSIPKTSIVHIFLKIINHLNKNLHFNSKAGISLVYVSSNFLQLQ